MIDDALSSNHEIAYVYWLRAERLTPPPAKPVKPGKEQEGPEGRRKFNQRQLFKGNFTSGKLFTVNTCAFLRGDGSL